MADFCTCERCEADRAAGRKPDPLFVEKFTSMDFLRGDAKAALRPRNSAERKAEPIHSGVVKYFPDALAAVARHSKKSNVKHNGPDAPLGWAREKSGDHEDCLIRHDLAPDMVDPETGEIEAVARAWRALADLQLREEKRLTAAGIMPYSGIVP